MKKGFNKRGNFMNKKWNEKTTLEKSATVISAIALVVWLFLQVLERTTSWAYTNIATYIAVCVICICEAYSFWNCRGKYRDSFSAGQQAECFENP